LAGIWAVLKSQNTLQEGPQSPYIISSHVPDGCSVHTRIIALLSQKCKEDLNPYQSILAMVKKSNIQNLNPRKNLK
jgi:hypothetical protein